MITSTTSQPATIEILDPTNNYYSTITSAMGNYESSGLKIFQLNVRGLNDINKFNQICANIDLLNCAFDVIVLTEVKLKQSCPLSLYNIDGYAMLSSLRADKGGGGVIAYIKNSIEVKNHTESSNQFEKIVAFLNCSKISIRLIAYYRAPIHSTIPEFLADLEDELSVSDMKTVILGDINIHSTTLSIRPVPEDNISKQYSELLSSRGYCVTNNLPTRPISARNIDHVTTNFHKQFNFHNDVIEIDPVLTDHNIIVTSIGLPMKPPSSISVIERTKIDHNKLVDNFPDIEHLVRSCENPNEIAEMLLNAMRTAVNASSSTIKFVVKHSEKIKEWMSNKTINLIIEKDKLLCKRRKKPHNNKIRDELRIFSEKLTQSSRNDYARYIKRKVSTNDRSKLWRNLNKILGRGDAKSQIKIVKDDGEMISNDAEVASNFNKFFSECAQNLRELRNTTENQYVEKNAQQSIVLQPPDTKEVESIIKALNGRSAAGHDELFPKVFKTLNSQLSPLIAHLIDSIFKTGAYPKTLKAAVITPIFKSGSKSSVDNYRPISVLPVLNKIVEKVIYKQLYSFVADRLKILYSRQFGFRPRCGTENAAIELTNLILRTIDEKKSASAIFMDLRKAFDVVNHELLLQVLEKYGIRGMALNVFRSYLSERQQIVKINGVMSEKMEILSGVVQGSCLGPLLFLIFINAMGSINIEGKLFLFADDAVLVNTHKTSPELQQAMIKDMAPIIDFFTNRQLLLNELKTNFMIFTSAYAKFDNLWEIQLTSNLTIKRVVSCKYLGLTIDENLRWTNHIENVEKKITSANAMLWKLREFLPFHTKKLIYDTLLQSHLHFMSPIWGLAACNSLANIQVLQNRALRNVYGLPRLTNRVDMYTHRVENHLPVRAIAVLNIASYVFNVTHGLTHSNIKFTTTESFHTRSLRKRLDLRPASKRTSFGAKSMETIGAIIFNRIPVEIKASRHQHAFKWTLRCHLRQENFIRSCFDATFFDLNL